MGIIAEYCPDLALRSFGTVGRSVEECLPEVLENGKTYNFLKKGQKHYWLIGEIPLRETKGEGILSRPSASVRIVEATHFLKNGELWTRGKYGIIEVYNTEDEEIHFDGLEKIKRGLLR